MGLETIGAAKHSCRAAAERREAYALRGPATGAARVRGATAGAGCLHQPDRRAQLARRGPGGLSAPGRHASE
eukprot:scaffold1484_cov241-Pinguiococcus_pyrenoidosus.AAC.24